jgi:GNAT superfamily N-acetyltransferase
VNAALDLAPTPSCAQRWRDQPYRETLTLRDGRAVLLRPAHRSDADALQRFFASLSPRARLLRFHGAVNRLPDNALQMLTTQVAQRHVALVATTHTDDGARTLLAEARYAVREEGEAEFAVTVADNWQGQGLGRALLQRLAVHARASGIQQLTGSVMPGNEPMLGLMTRLGAQLQSGHAEVTARMRL